MVGPDYCRRPSSAINQGWSYLAEEPIHPVAGNEEQWWTAFNDPVLEGLILQAVEQNLDVEEACHRIAEARYQLATVRGDLFPQANAKSDYSYRKASSSGNAFVVAGNTGGFNQISPGFNASWEPDIWGKIKRNVEASSAEVQMAQEDLNGIVLTLLSDIATNYIDIRTAQERISIAQANLEVQSQTLALTKKRHKAGLVGKLDVAQAESNFFTTQSQIPPLEVRIKQAQNRLCVLLGQAPTDLEGALGPGNGIPVSQTDPTIGVPADLLRRRPDIRRAERDVAANSARIGVALAELLPQLSIAGNISVDARAASSLFTTPSLAYSVGPSVTWNILNFGRVRNNIYATEERFEQSVVRYRKSVLTALEEVENGMVAFDKERSRVVSLQAAADATRKSVNHAKNRYARGLVNFQSVLDSERQLLSLEDQLAVSRGAVTLNLVSLYKAVGGGWQGACTASPSPVVQQQPAIAPQSTPQITQEQRPVIVEELPAFNPDLQDTSVPDTLRTPPVQSPQKLRSAPAAPKLPQEPAEVLIDDSLNDEPISVPTNNANRTVPKVHVDLASRLMRDATMGVDNTQKIRR